MAPLCVQVLDSRDSNLPFLPCAAAHGAHGPCVVFPRSHTSCPCELLHDANQGSAKKLFFQDLAPGHNPGEVCSRKGDAPNVDQVTMRSLIVPHGCDKGRAKELFFRCVHRRVVDQFLFLIKRT